MDYFPLVLMFLFLAGNVASIGYLWTQKLFSHLKLMMVLFWMMAIFFSGNLVDLGPVEVNSGVFFFIGYYLVGYILCKEYGPDGYIDLLKRQFLIVMLMFFCMVPLVLLQLYGYIERSVFDLKNLIDDIFIERIDYIALVMIAFYVGQLIYANSYKFISEKSFTFEFLLRIPIVMQIQSLLFYFLGLLFLAAKTGAIHIEFSKYLSSIYQIVVGGGAFRWISVFIIFIPFYFINRYIERGKSK